jgi:hypothetical protein
MAAKFETKGSRRQHSISFERPDREVITVGRLLRTEGRRPEGLGRDQKRMPDAKTEDQSDTLLADRVNQAGRLSALVGLACESVAVTVELRAVGRVIGRDVVATVSVGLAAISVRRVRQYGWGCGEPDTDHERRDSECIAQREVSCD